MEIYGGGGGCTESSGIDTSPDMNTSAEMDSPPVIISDCFYESRTTTTTTTTTTAMMMMSPLDRLCTVQPRKLFATPRQSSSSSLPPSSSSSLQPAQQTSINNNRRQTTTALDILKIKEDDPLQIPNITIESYDWNKPIRYTNETINCCDNNNNNEHLTIPDLTPKKYKSIEIQSPPYRGVKALKLSDFPPNSTNFLRRNRNVFNNININNNNNNDDNEQCLNKSMIEMVNNNNKLKPRALLKIENGMRKANVNPYTPDNQIHHKRMRAAAAGGSLKALTDINGFDKGSAVALENSESSPISVHKSQTNHRNNLMPKSLFKNFNGPINYGFNNEQSLCNSQKLMNNNSSSLIDIDNAAFELTDADGVCGHILDVEEPPKRLPLHETNISRFEKEFNELETIGEGETGIVYRCKNRLDGCIYAIKKSKKQVAGSSYEKIALNEVFGHAALGKHDNVVRYYSAWSENNYVYIQNEYCNGGSLQERIQKRKLNEIELTELLLNCAEGLKYIHSHDLYHMDIKPANIFLTKIPCQRDDGFDETDDDDDVCDGERDDDDENIMEKHQQIVYKIGDLGHVTSQTNPTGEEGDCRYLPQEILDDDFSNLAKADVFALGMTLFEAGGGAPLPKHGQTWHDLREGHVPDLIGISRKFNDLIKLMAHPDPNKRPSTTSLCDHPLLWSSSTASSSTGKSKAQLTLELQLERKKNSNLMKKLRETKQLLKSYQLSKTPPVCKRPRNSPIVSGRRLRSYSRKKQRKIIMPSSTLMAAATATATAATTATSATTSTVTLTATISSSSCSSNNNNNTNTISNNRRNIRDRNRKNTIDDFNSLP